jgi:integrase
MVQGLHKQGLSPKTIQNVHGCLSSALEQAKADGKIVSNPCEFVKIPKIVQKEINVLTVPQMAALLDAAAGDEYETVIYVCLFCGLRKGEALGLSWPQVDFEKNRITITQQLQRLAQKDGGYFITDGTKNGKTRYIDAPPFVMDVLKEVQRQQLLNRIKAGKAWRNEWDLVFTNDLGEHLQIPAFHKHFKKIAAAAGVPDVRIHDLRHSFATLSLANGDDVKTVQSNLGHATASFTLGKYIHASEQMKLDSANRMQTFFDQNLKKA